MSDVERDERLEFAAWTPDGAARLKASAEVAARALTEYAETVTAMTGDSDFGTIQEASARLSRVLLAMADAQFDYTGNSSPLDWLRGHDDEDADDEAETDAEPEAVAGISVLQRRDYEVTDEAAVLAAGRRAYLDVWAHDTEEQADADVSHLGRALYQITHRSGSASLDEVDGLRVTGGTIVIVSADQLLVPDPGKWPEQLFDHDPDRVLHRESDVYVD